MTREEAWRRTKGYLYDALSGEEADEIIKALEQETMPIDGDCISRKAVLSLLADHFDNVFDMVRELPPVAIPSAEPCKGMTNGEVMDKLFPEISERLYDDIFTEDWWNSPYKGEQE